MRLTRPGVNLPAAGPALTAATEDWPAEGLGTLSAEGGYLYPPLAGRRAFDIGAGKTQPAAKGKVVFVSTTGLEDIGPHSWKLLPAR